MTLGRATRYVPRRDLPERRGSQVGKAEVCKTFMHRFDSGPRLHCRMFRKNRGHTVADLPPTSTTFRVHHRENSNGKKRLCANPVELTLRCSKGRSHWGNGRPLSMETTSCAGLHRGASSCLHDGQVDRMQRSSIHEMIAQRVAHQLRRGCHIHFFQDARTICANGRHAQVKFFSDLAYRLPRTDHNQSFEFSS